MKSHFQRTQTHLDNFLLWSEKYTKTDMKYLTKGGAWLLLSQGLLFILSFVLLWAFANLTSQELYGQYRFFITVASILAIASLPGMKTAMIRAVAKGNSGIVPKIISTRIRWGLLGSLAALVGASYYFFQGDATLGGLFILTALFVPFYESYAVVDAYYNGLKDYKNFTITSVILRSVIILLTVLAILLSKDIYIIFGTYLLSTTAGNYFLYHYTIKRHPLSSTEDKETIPYGKQLSLMSVVATASGHLDKIALWYLAGPVQVAVYTIAMSLPKEISGAFSQVGILALPKMANRTKHELRQSLLRKVGIFFTLSLPLVLMYIFAAPIIFKLFLPQYLDTVLYSQVAALLIALTPLTLLTQYFQATMHTRALYTMQFVLPIILITLFFVLIPSYGVLGAVLAVLGRQAAGFLLLLFFFITDVRP